MNLKELVQEVNSALDYNPDIQAYTDQVIRVVNRHYLQVSSQYPWKFLQKKEEIVLRPDIAGSVDNRMIVKTVTVDYPSRRVYFDGDSMTLVNKQMEGQSMVLNYEAAENDTAVSSSLTNEGAGGFGQNVMITRAVIKSFPDTPDDKELAYETKAGGTRTDLDDDVIAGGRVDPSDYYRPDDDSSSYLVLESEMDDGMFNAIRTAADVVRVADGLSAFADRSVVDWRIEFRKFPLPKDCVEVLGIMDRGLTVPSHSVSDGTASTSKSTSPDKGRIVFLDSKKEEYLFLDRDNSGDPVVAIEDEWESLESPSMAPRLKISSSIKGSLVGTTTYQYCYTFLYGGVESPPSPVGEVTTVTDNSAVIIEDLEDTTCRTKDGETGRIKRLYRRMLPRDEGKRYGEPGGTRSGGAQRNTSTGPWLHVEDISEIGTTARSGGFYSGDAKLFIDQGNSHAFVGTHGDPYTGVPEHERMGSNYYTYHGGDKFKLHRLDEYGPRQYLRVYRPPSGDMKVEIRYLSRPRRMVMDNDYPTWPPQYHHLLVYLSLADICLQHGMTSQAQLYEKKADTLLDRMRQKYLAAPNRHYVRSGFDRSITSGERWGTPTKL